MTELSPQAQNLLIEVFQTAKGVLGRFVLLAGKAERIEELLQAKLITLEIEEGAEGEQWYAALTETGCEEAERRYRQKMTFHVELRFDTSEPNQARLFQELAEIANGNFETLLADLFALHEALGRGDIDALMNAYPEARATLQQMIRASVDSQLMVQEEHRINHLLGEISELKTMLSQQAQTAPRPIPQEKAAKEEDEDAPIPAPKPVIMRPVLPHSPQGQPKQLTVPQFSLPEDEEDSEDLFVVQKDEEAGKRASENFLQSLQRLQK